MSCVSRYLETRLEVDFTYSDNKLTQNKMSICTHVCIKQKANKQKRTTVTWAFETRHARLFCLTPLCGYPTSSYPPSPTPAPLVPRGVTPRPRRVALRHEWTPLCVFWLSPLFHRSCFALVTRVRATFVYSAVVRWKILQGSTWTTKFGTTVYWSVVYCLIVNSQIS